VNITSSISLETSVQAFQSWNLLNSASKIEESNEIFLDLSLIDLCRKYITDSVLESLANKFKDYFHGLKNLILNFEG